VQKLQNAEKISNSEEQQNAVHLTEINLHQTRKAYSYIRFSTPDQIKGDSLRRQTELSKQYASNHNLILDDSLKFQDLGVSAFSGKHCSENGALGQFLKLVEDGKIPQGSILIVESLDRLSREEVLKALMQFLAIITHGIKIVTLVDNREYSNNANCNELIYSLMEMSRSYNESALKSERIGKAWENKRTLAIDGTQKMTAKCPAWLKLTEDRKEYIVFEDRANIIRQIFEMKVAGRGVYSIVQELNKLSGIWKPAMNERKRGEGWRESYVKKILKNRAVIGECQPHKLSKGKREPKGERILDYFPKVIDQELFYRVQEQFRQNTNKGGRTGKINNLFSHIVKCGYCGSSMVFVDKGPAPKGGQYLVCGRGSRGLDCCGTAIKYEEVEKLTLVYCNGLRPQDILVKNNEKANSQLRCRIEGILGELNGIDSEIKYLTDSIVRTPDTRVREILEKKMEEKLDRNNELKKEIDQLQMLFNKTALSSEETQLTIDALNNLFNSLNTVEPEKRIEMRIRLRNEIRKLIRNIYVYPNGHKFFNADNIGECLEKISKHIPKETLEYKLFEENMQKAIKNPKKRRCFRINYIYSGYRSHWIYPEETKMLSLTDLKNAASFHREGWEQKAYRHMMDYDFKQDISSK
jgi:DNA invertase Pin-like site-specific DNA recombinase